jgi:hypothetical protein
MSDKYGVPSEFVAIPEHAPCGLAGCGKHDPQSMALVCVAVRRFGRVIGKYAHGTCKHEHFDSPGCGAVFVLNRDTGLRERAP